jgi:hypothetical protein
MEDLEKEGYGQYAELFKKSPRSGLDRLFTLCFNDFFRPTRLTGFDGAAEHRGSVGKTSASGR